MKPKMIRYWSDVVSRAAKETAAVTPWSSKGKLVVGLGSALLAGALIYSLTGNWLQSGLIPSAKALSEGRNGQLENLTRGEALAGEGLQEGVLEPRDFELDAINPAAPALGSEVAGQWLVPIYHRQRAGKEVVGQHTGEQDLLGDVQPRRLGSQFVPGRPRDRCIQGPSNAPRRRPSEIPPLQVREKPACGLQSSPNGRLEVSVVHARTFLFQPGNNVCVSDDRNRDVWQ